MGANEAFRAFVRTSWKSFRYRLEAAGCHFLERAIRRLSRKGCTGLGQLLGALVYTFDAHGRRVALANLEAVFGGSLTETERRGIARKSYQNFARTMLDLFWSQNVDSKNFNEYTESTGFEEVLERAKRENRGIVFVCAHQGNWEWAALAFAHVGGHANIVAQDFKNKSLTPIFANLRKHGQHTLISQDRAMLKLLKCVLRGENTALLADLNVSPSQGPLLLKVFGPNPLIICATQLHIFLAQRGNALLVPATTIPMADGRVRVTAHAPIETSPDMCPHKIAQETWAGFETLIRTNPELWLWSYKHFRFRPKTATREYPFYSSVSDAFETLHNDLK